MAVQPILEKIQTWLNETYKNSPGYNTIAVTGEPGWDTTNAMLIAYQIENGVSIGTINTETSTGIYDFTSEGFSDLSSSTDFSAQSNLNRLYILQGAFYVKGINPGGFQTPYNDSFSSAVSELQSNAGISQTGVVDLLVAKALLSMDAFVVLTDDGGVEAIANIQKDLNAAYAYDMGSLIPCDGVYGRELNKALIYAFQITEGISPEDANEADGYFGPGTQEAAPTIVVGNTNYFVTILQYALYCNGYTNVSFTGIYDSATETAVASFGRSMGISTNSGAQVDLNVWMGLLLSSGNPNRSVSGCDAAQRLSLTDAQILKSSGYNIVGRYLTGNFATTTEELTNILNAGLNVFPIYETGSYETSYFSAAQGTSDAVSAVQAARSFGIPQGTTIYFTVDYDMEGGEITNLVLPYFKAIFDTFTSSEFQYNIGVYGSRNVCSQVINAGFATLAFVDGASTGYSGNMGFNMPTMWAFNQIKEGVTIEGIQIDNDQVSGRDTGFNSLILSNNTIISQNKSVETTQLPDTGVSVNQFENFFSTLFTQIVNVKWIPDFKNPTLKTAFQTVYGKPHYYLDNSCYVRFEYARKLQFGSGSFITLYRERGEETLDFIPSGIGINLSKILDELLFKDWVLEMVKEIIPTASTNIFNKNLNLGLQVYPKWRPDEGSVSGYYELGAEIGVEVTYDMVQYICKEFKINFTENQIASLAGAYFCVDIILGISDDVGGFMSIAAAIIFLLKLLKGFSNNDISLGNNGGLVYNTSGNSLLNNYTTPEGRLTLSKEFTSEVATDF
ncbi:MAG: glycoside hydrolase domain-containing protein [Clostridium sp.]|uniref:glycoside hydrolase domain-containing protein n=1 Tax=Clostridium sp. TaxID=1506 RepID=UPI003EE51C12